MNKESQTSLFDSSKYKTVQQKNKTIKKHQEWLDSLTPDDKLYLKLNQNNNFATKHHIYSGKRCKELLYWYVTNSNLFGESITKLLDMINSINSKLYYHYITNTNPFKTKLNYYDTFILSQILKSISK